MRVGSAVQGGYFKVPFSGTITHMRPHTLNSTIVVHIDLDSPIVVFGDKRNAIAMEVFAPSMSECVIGFIKEKEQQRC